MLEVKDPNFFEKAEGKEIDFFLEDDMFEIEGKVFLKERRPHIEVNYAVAHILKITGEELEVGIKIDRPWAKRVADGKMFEMEINRVYVGISEPTVEDFKKQYESGVTQFFKKISDTLVWYNESEATWYMEVNRINMYCSGDVHEYKNLEELFEKGKEYMSGKWQCIYYSSEVEEE